MYIKKPSILAACIFILMHHLESAYAALPESCFQSERDYDIYLRYGDEQPPPPTEESNPPGLDSEQMAKEFYDGPAKKKPVRINVKQTQAGPGQKIYANASGSTTPSGSKTFAWGSANSGSTVSTTAEYSVNPGPSKGSYSNISLTVTDPVCDISDDTGIKMVNQY